jgi:hypothetical protein
MPDLPLKRYRLHFDVYASTDIEVDAVSEEAAREEGYLRVLLPSLCRRCAEHLDIHDIGEIDAIDEIEVDEED